MFHELLSRERGGPERIDQWVIVNLSFPGLSNTCVEQFKGYMDEPGGRIARPYRKLAHPMGRGGFYPARKESTLTVVPL